MKTKRVLPLLAVALSYCDGSGGANDVSAPSIAATGNACFTTERWCYSVEEIGPVWDSWPENTALSLNSRGVVVGTTTRWSTDPDPRRAFIFKRGKVLPLGGLGGQVGEARAVNDWGFAVGGSLDSEGHYRAVSYFNGVVTDLGSLDGTNSWSWSVNNFGFAAGNGFVSGVAHAAGFFHGKVFDLGTLGGETYANAVNDLFEVVGTGRLADGTWSGFIRRKGELVPLGTFGIPGPSTAMEINNRGTVCGSSYDANAYLRQAFLLHRDGSVVNLALLGYPFTYCSDVTDTGVAVGIADDGVTGWRAAVWVDPSEPPIDLNSRVVPAMPDVQLFWADKINAFGMITAHGYSFTKNQVEGYLLSPKPCPK